MIGTECRLSSLWENLGADNSEKAKSVAAFAGGSLLSLLAYYLPGAAKMGLNMSAGIRSGLVCGIAALAGGVVHLTKRVHAAHKTGAGVSAGYQVPLDEWSSPWTPIIPGLFAATFLTSCQALVQAIRARPLSLPFRSALTGLIIPSLTLGCSATLLYSTLRSNSCAEDERVTPEEQDWGLTLERCAAFTVGATASLTALWFSPSQTAALLGIGLISVGGALLIGQLSDMPEWQGIIEGRNSHYREVLFGAMATMGTAALFLLASNGMKRITFSSIQAFGAATLQLGCLALSLFVIGVKDQESS